MKRYFRILAAMTALSITFAACSDDDEESITPEEPETPANSSPKAAFSYSSADVIYYNDTEVTFTDQSTDEDGEIVAWSWTFGSSGTSTEQNPVVTLPDYGDVVVSLTVTDDGGNTNTASKTIGVERVPADSIALLWKYTYETDGASLKTHVTHTTPSVSLDGNTIYAFSSAYRLFAFSKDGEVQWSYDVNKDADPYNSSGTKLNPSCAPVLDKEGNIYLIVGVNGDKTDTSENQGIWSFTSDGQLRWYVPFGYLATFGYGDPVIVGDYLIFATGQVPSDITDASGNALTKKGHVLNKDTGAYVQNFEYLGSSYTSIIGLSDNKTIVAHNGGSTGSLPYFLENDLWTYYGTASASTSIKLLGRESTAEATSTPYSSSTSMLAATDDGLVYAIYTASGDKGYLFCYDMNKYTKDDDTRVDPEWVAELAAYVNSGASNGMAIDENGNIYVICTKSIQSFTSEGKERWTYTVDSSIYGCPAIDDQGYVYFVYSAGGSFTGFTLVKLDGDDGSVVATLAIGVRCGSGPTIAPDGTIYVTTSDSYQPTICAIESSSMSPADSPWSQQLGGPHKNPVVGYYD